MQQLIALSCCGKSIVAEAQQQLVRSKTIQLKKVILDLPEIFMINVLKQWFLTYICTRTP